MRRLTHAGFLLDSLAEIHKQIYGYGPECEGKLGKDRVKRVRHQNDRIILSRTTSLRIALLISGTIVFLLLCGISTSLAESGRCDAPDDSINTPGIGALTPDSGPPGTVVTFTYHFAWVPQYGECTSQEWDTDGYITNCTIDHAIDLWWKGNGENRFLTTVAGEASGSYYLYQHFAGLYENNFTGSFAVPADAKVGEQSIQAEVLIEGGRYPNQQFNPGTPCFTFVVTGDSVREDAYTTEVEDDSVNENTYATVVLNDTDREDAYDTGSSPRNNLTTLPNTGTTLKVQLIGVAALLGSSILFKLISIRPARKN